MYILTVKISDRGTILREGDESATGHMWYSLSENGVSVGSYGFAPIEEGKPFGPGKVHRNDDSNYASNFYTGKIVITKEQFDILKDFGTDRYLNGNPYDFSTYYNGLTNSCIDYTWKALYYVGINPSDFEGQLWPTWNADDVDRDLYKYLFGNTIGWDESLSDAGGYNVVYGSRGNDVLISEMKTNAVYGGDGNDNIYGGISNEKLYGNAGNDYLEGGKGEDTLRGGADSDVLLGGTETDYLYGDSGDDTLLGGDDKSTDILFGGSGQDTLLGQGGDDVLAGGVSWDNLYGEKESDYLLGGTGFDTYYVSNSDTINDADSNGLIMFNDKSLGGKKRKVEGSDNLYEDDYFVYALNGNDMVVVEKTTQEYITIENFNFNSKGFGIDFSESDPDKQDIELQVSDATTTEGGDLVFNVSINHALKYDLTVDVASYFNGSADEDDLKNPISGTVTIPAGAVSAEFTISTIDDTIEEPTEKFIFAATNYKYAGENKQDNDLGSLLIMNTGEGTIEDNETPTPLEVSVSDASLDEANAMMSFSVSLNGVLEDNMIAIMNTQAIDYLKREAA